MSTERLHDAVGDRLPAAVYTLLWSRFCGNCDRPVTRWHAPHYVSARARQAIADLVTTTRIEETEAVLEQSERDTWGEPDLDMVRVDLAGRPLPPLPPPYGQGSA